MVEKAKKDLVEEYLKTLKERGFRLTNQRKIIIETLLDNIGSHPNAQELLQKVQEIDPSVGIATVYRTVEILNQMGLLNLMNLEEGFNRFEIPGETMHFHTFCKYCGKILHLNNETEKEEMVKKWIEETGFKIIPQTFEISGICSECAEDIEKGDELICRCPSPNPACRYRKGFGPGKGKCRMRWCNSND